MARTQQTFRNGRDRPIYVSVEPWPECFELEAGDELTLIWNAPETGDAAQVHFLNDRELIVYPDGDIADIVILFNGGPSEGRSWVFKHAVKTATVRDGPEADVRKTARP
jgi:hypothetical protein